MLNKKNKLKNIKEKMTKIMNIIFALSIAFITPACASKRTLQDPDNDSTPKTIQARTGEHSMANSQNSDDIYFVIPLEESMAHVTKGLEETKISKRNCHLLLGAKPTEAHIKQMINNDATAESIGYMTPFRTYFCFAYKSEGAKISTPKAPLITHQFNEEQNWDALLNATGNPQQPFCGMFDAIYFDVSTLKFARWDISIFYKILKLLKPDGALFLPDINLESTSIFDISTVTQRDYQNLTREEKGTLPYQEKEKTPYQENVVSGGCLTPLIKHDDDLLYVYNGKSLFYDVFIRTRAPHVPALTIEHFEDNTGYPDIGFDYRTEPDEYKNVYLKIHSYIKITHTR